MDSTKLLLIGGIALLGGLYITDKNKKQKTKSDLQPQLEPESEIILENKPITTVDDLSGFFTPAEATKKALEVVTKWISLLDAIPKEALIQENNNVINQRINDEKEKEARIGYLKALEIAKFNNQPKFSYQDATYWTANQSDVRNGSYVGSVFVNNPNYISYNNPFITNGNSSRDYLLAESLKLYRFNDKSNPTTLGDYIKYVKSTEFSNVYDILKDVFTKLPKKDVNKLVDILPKYLMAVNDNFAYFQTEYEKNPFTIEEQLYLKDINIEDLLSPKKAELKSPVIIY